MQRLFVGRASARAELKLRSNCEAKASPELKLALHPEMKRGGQAGVTLIEMLVVIALISIIAGISYPSVSSGLESVRLGSAADSVSAFLQSAVNRAERRQELMEISISRPDRALAATGVNYQKRLDLPTGIAIAEVYPAAPIDANVPRRFLIYPGGAPPRVGLRLANERGAQRLISLDPITGIPQVERIAAK